MSEQSGKGARSSLKNRVAKKETASSSKEVSSPSKEGKFSPKDAISSPKETTPHKKENMSPISSKKATSLENFVESKKVIEPKEGSENGSQQSPEKETSSEELSGHGDCGISGWSNWLNSTVCSAKELSSEMLTYLKQDITEFGETVQEAGRDLKNKLKLEDTAKTAVDTMGGTMNVLMEQLTALFGIGPEDEDEEIYVGNSGSVVVDRVQAKIYSMSMNESIYTEDPEDKDEYEKWLENFDLAAKNDEMSGLLSGNPHLQLHHAQLVPDKVCNDLFWHRFYYHMHKIIQEEKRTLDRQPTAHGSGGHSKVSNTKMLSEEDQQKLLSDYQEEIAKEDICGPNLSRRSSATHLSSSSTGSFAFVTHDTVTDEVKIE